MLQCRRCGIEAEDVGVRAPFRYAQNPPIEVQLCGQCNQVVSYDPRAPFWQCGDDCEHKREAREHYERTGKALIYHITA